MSPLVHSVNVGAAREIRTRAGVTGIDKVPVSGAVAVRAPRRDEPGKSGLAGDYIHMTKLHGGADQAVYAYAREDLDWWEQELSRELRAGCFGENLTTLDLDVSGALLGERWRIAGQLVLEVTKPRIPCGTFAAWMGRNRWQRRFIDHGAPGAYLRVIQDGELRAGDPIEIEFRPDHAVSIGRTFAALMGSADLLAELLPADRYLTEDVAARVHRQVG
jgi:MOSC domain-containing protein YiiM